MGSATPTWITAALLLGGMMPTQLGGAEGGAARVEFRIVVPHVLRVSIYAHSGLLLVEEDDVRRGFVELERATALRVTSNNRSGYRIAPTYVKSIVKRLVMRLPGVEAELASGEAAHVPDCRCGEHDFHISYRLYLADELAPGIYAWPIALRLEAQDAPTPSMPFP